MSTARNLSSEIPRIDTPHVKNRLLAAISLRATTQPTVQEPAMFEAIVSKITNVVRSTVDVITWALRTSWLMPVAILTLLLALF